MGIIYRKTFKGNKPITIDNVSWLADPDHRKGLRDDWALGFIQIPEEGEENQPIRVSNCTIDANGTSEGLKFKYCKDVIVSNCTIIGGYEDCVDIIESSGIIFRNCKFVAKNTKNHITIKSSSSDIQIIDCEFVGEKDLLYAGACVDLGNWSDPDVDDRPKTKRVTIENCKLTNFRKYNKVVARRLHAKSPTVINTPGFVLNVPSLFVKLFWKLRRYQMKKEA